jgi:hypothetical protein
MDNIKKNNNFVFNNWNKIHGILTYTCTVIQSTGGIPPEPYSKKIQNDHIQHKNKINVNVWEPHTEGENRDKRQFV